MKSTIKLFALITLIGFSSCKKEKDSTPALQCKLTTIDRGNLNKHAYTYDAAGKITTMTREFDGNGSGKVSKYVYTLTYDAAGLLASSVITLDGVADSKEKYTYTNGKVSRTDFEYTDGSKGYNVIKFDTKGNLTEFTYQSVDRPEEDVRQYFEYDANNIMIKRGFSDITGSIKFFEVATKPVGIFKLPESLILSGGLPYDLLTGFGYQSNSGGVGSESEAFGMDENGVFGAIPDSKFKISAIKTNLKGYITELTYLEADNQTTSLSTFGLIDCQ